MKSQITNIGLILILFFSFLIIKAQENGDLAVSQAVEVEDQCGLKSNLVQIDVSAWSNKKGFLQDLTHKDFEIYDEKEIQPIICFKKSDEPISIGILLDLSESVKKQERKTINEIPFAVEGLINFINKSNPQNEYFIVGFSKDVSTILEPSQDKKEINDALQKVLKTEPKGNTSVFDAMDFGFEKLTKGKHDKKVLLVISDGLDNSSKKSDYGEIKKQSRKQNALVYLINILTTDNLYLLSLNNSTDRFGNLTEISGGRMFFPKNRAEVVGAFELLSDELNNQYLIGYVFDGSKTDEKWHDVEVKLNLPKEKRKDFGKIYVRAQKGYLSKN